MVYKDYLKTEHWQELRKAKYKKKHRKCSICCNSNKLEVHHLSYKHIYDVKTEDLRVLCRGCHGLLHKIIKEKNISFRIDASHYSIFAKSKALVKYYKKNNLKYKQFWHEEMGIKPKKIKWRGKWWMIKNGEMERIKIDKHKGL